MLNPTKRMMRALSLATLLVAVPTLGTFAQDAAAPAAEAPAAEAPAADAAAAVNPDTVVATVGGDDITEADLSFAAEDMAQDLAQMPPEERRAFLVRILIDMKVMSKAARDAGMDQTDLFAQRQKYLEERALRRAYFAETIAGAVTPEAVQAEYDNYVAQFQPEEQIRASHILVATKEEADTIKAELDAGGDFAELARENSLDGSSQDGGNLGFFTRGMMVPPFEEAAFALANPGDISAPVESQFGFHIIKLDEKGETAPPALDQVAPQIQQQLLQRAFVSEVDKLMAGVQIDIVDPALKASFDAQEEAEAAAAGAAASEDAPAEAAPTEEAAPAAQ